MTYFDYNIGQDSLQDAKDGKVRKWRDYKRKSLLLSDAYHRLGDIKRAINVSQCGTVLDFVPEKIGGMKLVNAYFCKDPLCSMCAWRRSLKIFGQTSKIMDVLEEQKKFKYIFATFTVRNVAGDELSSTLDKLYKAFNLMTKRKEFKKLSHGFFRALEITHKWENSDDYHPHFHVIIAVNGSYAKDPSVYLTHEKWVALWQSCLGIDYEPWVDVRMVKPNKNGTYGKTVAEVSKYAVKSKDYIIEPAKGQEHNECLVEYCKTMTDEAVMYLHNAIYGRRLIAYGGLFREIKKRLGLDDIENGDLIDTDNEKVRGDLEHIILRYRWHVGYCDYILAEVVENAKLKS